MSRAKPRSHIVCRSLRLVFVAACGLACVVICDTAIAAEPSPPSYDPAACHQDARGQYYIAVGRVVFGIPSPRALVLFPDRVPIQISPLMSEGARLLPPIPSEQVGCLGNPAQLDSFEWCESLFVGDGPGKASTGGMSLFHMHLSGVGQQKLLTEKDADQAISFVDKDWLWDSNRLGWHYKEDKLTSLCNVPDTVIESQPDLVTCWRRSVGRDAGPILYVMRPPLYSEPKGGDFIVMCIDGVNRMCDTGYRTAANYAISYEIFQNKLSSEETVRQLVAFDKSLRQVVESHRIKNYPWPSQHSPEDVKILQETR